MLPALPSCRNPDPRPNRGSIQNRFFRITAADQSDKRQIGCHNPDRMQNVKNRRHFATRQKV